MKKITHYYGAGLDWVEPLAKELEGRVEGNFIVVPEHINVGDRYFLDCEFGISVLYVDIVYNCDIFFRQENKTDDFVGIYYNLTEGEAIFLTDGNVSNSIGRWNYNLFFIDSSLQSDYIVKNGSRTFALCIFIKKEIVKGYLKNNPSFSDHLEEVFDPKKNTIVKFTRMSNESYHLLNDLRTKDVRETSFDFHLRGVVQSLLADYIEKMIFQEIVIDTVYESDLKEILKSQAYLIDNLYEVFPSISLLAAQANMSQSKYKKLFKKITGLTPSVFFANNKLIEAKSLLAKKHLTIGQVSDALKFTSHSYFILKFKEAFGMSPKNFIKQLQ